MFFKLVGCLILSMTIEGEPQASGEVADPQAVERNVARVEELIEEDIQSWKAAIEAGDGSAIHHAGEIRRLSEHRLPIAYLIQRYDIAEPADPRFVIDLVDMLSSVEREGDVSGLKPSLELEAINVKEAVEALKVRNSEITAEAA